MYVSMYSLSFSVVWVFRRRYFGRYYVQGYLNTSKEFVALELKMIRGKPDFLTRAR